MCQNAIFTIEFQNLSCRAQSRHLNISRLDFSTTLRFGRNDREIAF